MLIPFKFQIAPYDKHVDQYLAIIPKGINSKSDLFNVLYSELKLPGYFGFNFDALDECLRDFHWVKDRNIIIFHQDIPGINDRDLILYLSTLETAIIDWRKDTEHSLTVIFPEEVRDKIEEIFMTKIRSSYKPLDYYLQFARENKSLWSQSAFIACYNELQQVYAGAGMTWENYGKNWIRLLLGREVIAIVSREFPIIILNSAGQQALADWKLPDFPLVYDVNDFDESTLFTTADKLELIFSRKLPTEINYKMMSVNDLLRATYQ